MFASRGGLDDKRARTEGWKTRQAGEARGIRSDYSAGLGGADVRSHDERAQRARPAQGPRQCAGDPDARLFVESAPEGTVAAQEHCVTSDFQRALATGAHRVPEGQIVIDRNEGRFLASANEDGNWFGISKVILTLRTSQGQDALLTGVPPSVVDDAAPDVPRTRRDGVNHALECRYVP